MKSISSREFNQDVSNAKRLARDQPVFVTDRGKPTHVLLSIDTYRQMIGKPDSLPDLLAAAPSLPADLDWRSLGPWSRG
ncbi:type II toxin-antitoxin system Phd/YefM family antitoxin [Sphingomonas piscis]|uniref:Antitoxin n=1 Tax=Sphingomonas piscis TaxID=2714943 RepID=A0A6G7YND5_9SPHN|nr:type II toxin-antitoxin system Phd/YefM family antitoxin [Sphingomonas piscis]QIK78252.1 type II toxin-antitoxin system Phd/YefM family antitoxin [Sphingomonas piscis]